MTWSEQGADTTNAAVTIRTVHTATAAVLYVKVQPDDNNTSGPTADMSAAAEDLVAALVASGDFQDTYTFRNYGGAGAVYTP